MGWASPDPVATAAEFYYCKQSYRQALQLWRKVLVREPTNLGAALRVAELTLLFEGRGPEKDFLLKFYSTTQAQLGVVARETLENRFGALQGMFLTDEGQSDYLQALSHARYNDCSGAAAFLAQAAQLEPGNIKVLREKAACERKLGSYNTLYETLDLAVDTYPFDSRVVDNFVETDSYFGQYAKVLGFLQKYPEMRSSMRASTAYAVALAETGDVSAVRSLQAFIAQEKSAGVHPVVLFELGKLLASRPDSAGEATLYLERFGLAAAHPENTTIESWDPYRCAEKKDEAARLLATLKHS